MTPSAGPVGSSVSLRGSFPDDTRVRFGGREIAATRAAGGLQFTVPNAPPGVHAVELRAGRESANAGQFRVGPAAPGAVVTPVVPPVVAPVVTPVARPRIVRPARLARLQRIPTVTGFAPHRGPAGTVVTIRGARLPQGVQVVLGGRVVPATVTPSAITFTVPAGASTGPVLLRQRGAADVMVGTFRVGTSRRDEARARAREEQLRREAEAAWRARQSQLAADRAARREALRQHEAALAQSREERRLQQLAALRERWEQSFLRRPEVLSELALHAERIAQLDRMRRLAEAEKDDLVVRITMLVNREVARHERRMNDLRAAFGG